MFRKVKRRTDGRRNFDTPISLSPSSASALLQKIYPHRLSFYRLPPTNEITLDQFETYALDRLKLLLEIESLQARGKSFHELVEIIGTLIDKYIPLNPVNKVDAEKILEQRRKDHCSHFILRLAFCRSEELRKRFVRVETTLFKIRYASLSKNERRLFVESIGLPWEAVNSEEKTGLKDELVACCFIAVRGLVNSGEFGGSSSKFMGKKLNDSDVWECLKDERFWKLPWEYVSDLVAARQVLVKKGWAYVPEYQQASLVAGEFSRWVEEQLVVTMRALPGLDEDERLVPVLNNISKGYVNSEYQGGYSGEGEEGAEGEINSSNVNDFVKHFPLCMHRLMDGLKQNHHLKYTGRQELSLFLKGIGLGPEEALNFWQREFTSGGSGTSIEQFNKEYRYTFRHNYGLEGGRINYKPWDCRTILSKPKPNKYEYHGCPYRDLHRDNLSSQLKNMGLQDDNNLDTVLELSERGEFQVACTKVFELLNKNKIDECINQGVNIDESSIVHPNQYFDRARYLEKRLGEKSVTAVSQ